MANTVRRLPSNDALEAHRLRQQQEGFDYELTATSIGLDTPWVATVRRITVTEDGAIDNVPQHLQTVVAQGLADVQAATEAAKRSDRTFQAIVAENKTILTAADPFCVAAFIDPPLVMTKEELATAPENAVVVTNLAPEDRIGAFLFCANARSEQAKLLRFRREQSQAYVPNRPAGPVAAATLRSVEPAG